MNKMRGIAHQRDAVGDERARDEETERMRPPRTDCRDLAEMQLEALFELRVKCRIGQRHDARGFAPVFGPYDGRTPAAERQDRKRAGGEKMLFGAALVI